MQRHKRSGMSAPGRAEMRDEPVAAPGPERCGCARCYGAHQPRHRAAGLRRPGAGERIRAHARAVHGRRVPVSGQIRLRDRRRVEAGRPSCGPRRCSPCIRIRAVFDVPAEAVVPVAGRRAAARARCSPPIWRRRSTRCGTARPAPADRIAVVGGGVVGRCWSPICARGCRAPR